MKQGRTMQEIGIELDRQRHSKHDYMADTNAVLMHRGMEPQPVITMPDIGTFGITDHAHGQIASRIRIPYKYYDRMLKDAPDLLMDNVNHWFQKEPEKRMLRTLDGKVRAFLSDRYRPLDNLDLVESVLPAVAESGADIVSADITDNRIYFKAIVPDRKIEIGPPDGWEWGKGLDKIDVVQPGIVISNSEVGAGALSIQPAIHTVRCSNLAAWNASRMRRTHVGGSLAAEHEGDDAWKYVSDDTRRLADAAIWAQVRDLAKAALDEDSPVVKDIVDSLRRARGDEIEGNPSKVVEVLATNHGLIESEKDSVLNHLIRGGDLTRYGVHAAVTRAASDIESYDRASELETLGGTIIELPKNDWQALAVAA